MTYHRVLAEEARLPIGSEIVFVNALHGMRDVHEGEAVAAYEDCDRRLRVSAYAVLHAPKRVYTELMQLSRGRWSADEALSFVQQAAHHVRGQLTQHG